MPAALSDVLNLSVLNDEAVRADPNDVPFSEPALSNRDVVDEGRNGRREAGD